MSYRVRLWCSLSVVFVVTTGVSRSDERKKKAEVADSKPEIHLKDASWKTVKTFVQQQKGKVVVLDIWSTSCPPCMKEFPNLVRLKERYGDKVVCVSLNVDYAGIKSKPPKYYRPKVKKFLSLRKATFQNFLATEESLEVFDALELASIPAVFVYGKDGKMAKRFDDDLLRPGEEEAFTYKKDINPFVAGLIK